MNDEPGEIYYVTLRPAVRAVQLTDETNWETVAEWCGGELLNVEQGQSGEYETELRIAPMGLGLAWTGVTNDWVIRGIMNEFSIRSPEEFDSSYSRDVLPPRVKAAEERARLRELLDAFSLGASDAKAHIEHSRRMSAALPDRWVTLCEKDLICLFEMYRDLREIEGHDDALQRVLTEIDFEPSRSDLDD